MKELIEEIDQFNKERDWDQFHSPENLAKSISICSIFVQLHINIYN